MFIEVPHEYVFHDELINPRGINTRIGGLIKEFHRGNPQLQVCLARLDGGRIKIFEGQHKTAAQILLGQTLIVMRLFIDPDVQRLITTNTNAGSRLKQVAFDKSIMHQLSNTLYGERIQRYQAEHEMATDEFGFSEQSLVSYFKGQADLRKYIIEAQKNQITHSPDNRLTAYINFDGRRKELPLSYSSYDKAILARLIDSKLILDTPLDFREEENRNPRQIERRQIIRFLNILADRIYVDKFDPEIGTYRIESNVAKGNGANITNDHLAAYRIGTYYHTETRILTSVCDSPLTSSQVGGLPSCWPPQLTKGSTAWTVRPMAARKPRRAQTRRKRQHWLRRPFDYDKQDWAEAQEWMMRLLLRLRTTALATHA